MVLLKRTSTVFVLVFFGLLFCGCQITYLSKNAYHQTKILLSRKSIDSVLKDPNLDPITRQKLLLVKEVKHFAESELGLKESANYSTYVDLKRKYVTWIVQAAPAYEVKAHMWKFPIVGSMPYKGYFNEADAHKEAATFNSAEFDTYVRGVTAYSSLGWFNDPILNTMVVYDDADLVNLIIHETVHATLFFKDEVDLNERMATFLADIGTEMFYLKKEGIKSPTVELIRKEQETTKKFSEFLSREIRDLNEFYNRDLRTMTKDKKQNYLLKIQQRFLKEFPSFKNQRHLLLESDLNNAKLLSMQIYYYDLDDFKRLHTKLGSDFVKTLTFLKSLAKNKRPIEALKRELGDSTTENAETKGP